MTQQLRSWAAGIVAAVRDDPIATPLSVFVGSRVLLYGLLTFLVGLLPGITRQTSDFWFLLRRWDGNWYYQAAEEGHQWAGPAVQSTAAFFPLYPALGRLFGTLVDDTHWGLFIVTNASFAAYLYFLYWWSSATTDRESAERAIIYGAAFPAAFVLGSFYAESLLLALFAATFWLLQVRRYRLAILAGMLAAATRPTGLAIFLPVAWALWQERRGLLLASALVLIPLGPGLYEAYLWSQSGDPLAFLTLQRLAWFQVFTPPWDTVRFAVERMTWAPWSYPTAIAWLDGGSILLFIALVYGTWRWRSTGEFLFAAALLVLTLAHTVDPTKGPLTQSASRHLMALLPCFVVLGTAARGRYLNQVTRWLFVGLQTAFAAYFFAGHWVV